MSYSFSRKMINGTIVLTSLLIVIVFAFVIFQQKRHVRQLIDEGLLTSANELSAAISLELKVRNIHGIQNIIGKSHLVKKARFLTVGDDLDEIIYASPNPDSQYSEATCDDLYRKVPVLYRDERIGTLSYCFNPSDITGASSDLVLILAMACALLSWGMILVYWLSLSARRINRFVSRLEQVDPEHPALHEVPVEDANDPTMRLLYEKMDRLVGRLKEASDEIQRRKNDEFLSELSRQVAHDIRSPLTALMAAVQGENSLPENRRNLIQGAIQRIQDIASDLLQKSREAQSNRKPGDVEYRELVAILEDLVSEKLLEVPKSVTIEIEAPPGINFRAFSLNKSDFRRSISNLINNSVEAFNGGGKIKVVISSGIEELIVEVKDDGPGIPEEFLSRLTEKGFTVGKENGSGLGLYFANKVLREHKGRLDIETAWGRGTSIKMYFPVLGLEEMRSYRD